jgi:hypothetical protein
VVDHGPSSANINGTLWSDSLYDSIRINGGDGGTVETIRGNVKPLAVFNRRDFDEVDIGDTSHRVQGIQAALDIENPPQWNVVNIDDYEDSSARLVIVQSVAGNTYEQVALSGSAPINIKANDARAVYIASGTGANQVYVFGTCPLHGPGATFLLGHSANTQVTVGLNHSVQSIQGEVSISNPISHSSLVVDDSADGVLRGNIVVSSSAITGLAPAPISYAQEDLSSLGVLLGTGGATVNVRSTPFNQAKRPQTLITPNSAGTTVNVGNAGSVAAIAGTLHIGGAGVAHPYVTLNVDDSADSTYQANVSLDSNDLTGLGLAHIILDNHWLSSLTVSTGTGGANVYVGTGMTLMPYSSNTTVRAHAPGLGSLGGILNVFPAVGGTSLILDDYSDPGSFARPVTIFFNGVIWQGEAQVYFDAGKISAVTISGAPRAYTYKVTGVVVPTTLNIGSPSIGFTTVDVTGTTAMLTIDAGGGNHTLAISLGDDMHLLDSFQGPVIIGVPAYPPTTVLVNDSGFAGNDTYTITGTSVSVGRLGGFSLTYTASLASLDLKTGPGSDIFNIESASVPTQLDAGTGGNTFHVTPTDQYLADIAAQLVIHGGGSDVLAFFDTANPNSETYTFDATPSTLTLATLPNFAAQWDGIGSVYLETNGSSTVDDASGTVLVDVPPPSIPDSPKWEMQSAPTGADPVPSWALALNQGMLPFGDLRSSDSPVWCWKTLSLVSPIERLP